MTVKGLICWNNRKTGLEGDLFEGAGENGMGSLNGGPPETQRQTDFWDVNQKYVGVVLEIDTGSLTAVLYSV